MATAKSAPTTLLEAIRHFADLDVCVEYVAAIRWADGPVCPTCDHGEHYYLKTRRIWKCKACKRQFSIKVGTIFEDSPLGLNKWLPAVWLAANSKNGISSYELGRALGVSQKSAWFMLHRIRKAMETGSFDKFDGTVEVDETYIGGKARNMHKADRERKFGSKTGRGGRSTANKAVVLGMVERGGTVRAQVVTNIKRPTLQAIIRDAVASGVDLYTDALPSYTGLEKDFDHRTVNHAFEYVDGNVHTNTIENFWALLKRGLHGTYVSVRPFHLFRYLDERMFTFNEREIGDLARFNMVLASAAGRRLTYAELTGKA